MTATVGHSLLVTALLLSVWGLVASIVAARRQWPAYSQSAERAATSAFVLLTIGCLLLIRAFVVHDFSIRYVAEYSSRSMPLFYLVSSLWAGQAGSLLFWAWLLTLYTVMVIRSEKRSGDPRLLPATLTTLFATVIFFLVLATVTSNPFERLPHTPIDGRGLNPLLRNPMMVFHPPSLYIGFVGFTVPFAFAMAALSMNRLDIAWIRKIRRWALFAWLFLTVGNLLGAQWAYVELGWGGYWGWDPVENGSLMPWITGTAFLHSVVVQERRGMFRVWNFSLIIITFALTVLGTFITRSGVISSVHAFGQSSMGPLFLVFLFAVLGISFGLLFRRMPALRASLEIRSVLSQESTILLTNVVLSGLALVVFWGTLFPTISEAFLGKSLTIQTPWFSRMSRPFGIALLALLTVCRLVNWGQTSWSAFTSRFVLPMAIGIFAAAFALFTGVRHGWALVAYGLAASTLASMIEDALRIARARARVAEISLGRSLWELINRQRRLYGSYVVHIGVALMFIGIVGSSTFSKSVMRTVSPGDSLVIGRYEVKFEGLTVDQERDRISVVAHTAVSNSGKPLGHMTARKDFYPNYDPVSEVGIRSRLNEDLYLILAGYEKDGRATLQVKVNPLTLWIWIGGAVMVLGTILAWLPPRGSRAGRNKRKPERR